MPVAQVLFGYTVIELRVFGQARVTSSTLWGGVFSRQDAGGGYVTRPTLRTIQWGKQGFLG